MTHWKDLPQACWELNFAHQTSGHGMFGGLSLLALLRRQLVVSPHATAGSVYCSTRVSVGQQRGACALTKRTVVQGECRKPQCTCPFPAAHKPTNQTRGVDIPKHQSVSASCQTTIKHMGGSLLASHGIISYVRWTFASECSLPCVPNLFKQVLMLIHPLPCQGIKLIEPMEI